MKVFFVLAAVLVGVFADKCTDEGGRCQLVISSCKGPTKWGQGYCSTILHRCCFDTGVTPTDGPGEVKPIENSPNCGLRKTTSRASRIVGGEDAEPGEFPWQVTLRLQGNHVCGGSILTSTYVLTAAHCFMASSNTRYYTVRVGEHQKSVPSEFKRDHAVKRIINHPDWKGTSGSVLGDIALIELSTPIDLESDYANEICLPTDNSNTYAGQSAIVAGWGMTNPSVQQVSDKLKKLTAPVLTNSNCNSFSNWAGKVKGTQLCQFSNSGSACRGDSGGPLVVVNSEGRHEVIGVVSWGIPTCRGKPTVYTRVTSYTSWISQFIYSD